MWRTGARQRRRWRTFSEEPEGFYRSYLER
jgi:hypothetical protein